VNIYPTAIENVVRRFEAIEEFQITVSMLRELRQLEVQIEVAPDCEPEEVRARVEQAIYYAISLRPRVTIAKPGDLARFEMKARRFRRLDTVPATDGSSTMNLYEPTSKADKFLTR
jgi:phenylacetate-CoA ligase